MPQTLSETQSAALLDILSHYDTYAEIRDFRLPGSLKYYGPPFNHKDKKPSTAPALQSLVSRFLLTLPGLKDLSDDFWKVHCHDIIEAFEAAELSESYDRGSIGSRKTLATAISALIEYPVRGTFGGISHVEAPHGEYDLSNANDLARAFRDFLDQAVYGGILDEMVKKTAETDQLADHPPLTQAVHEFVLVNLASFMHYILILSPKGQYLLKLIENVHKLIPYMLVRQTLKVGNVASMINAMVKIGLAKMSVTSFTNWVGLTNNDDEGMNLMQQIISTVLNFDVRDLESRAAKIEKDREGPTKDQLKALKNYKAKSREEHDRIRMQSQKESISIATAALKSASVSTDLNEKCHKQALDYLSVNLSIRDRKEIIQVLCHSTPDHLTTSIRSLVSAYEPVIRHLHNAIDLSDTVWDLEMFLKDMIKLAKVQPPGSGTDNAKTQVPSVGDFIQLLKKHQFSCHKFVHQCCKNGEEVTSWYLEWAKVTASKFRRKQELKDQIPKTGAGDLTPAITKIFEALEPKTQQKILPVLDAQTVYLENMHAASLARLSAVVSSPPSGNPVINKIISRSNSRSNSRSRLSPSRASSRPGSRTNSPSRTPTTPREQPTTPTTKTKLADSIDPDEIMPTGDDAKPAQATDPTASPPLIDVDPGPGAYLSRWQDLLDNTPITPLTPRGKVNRASSKNIVESSATDVDGSKLAEFPEKGGNPNKSTVGSGGGGGGGGAGGKLKGKEATERPDVRPVVDALGPQFRELLAERSLYW